MSPEQMLRQLHETYAPLGRGWNRVLEPVRLRGRAGGPYSLTITKVRWDDGETFFGESARDAIFRAWFKLCPMRQPRLG